MAEEKNTGNMEEETAEELILVGEEYLAEGKYEEAIEVYREIVRRDPLLPTLAKACNDCGAAYASLKQYEMAISFFNAALNLSDYLLDDGISACYNLVRVYRLIDDEEKVQQYIKRAELIKEEQKIRNDLAQKVLPG
ncbi:Tetratricopeptide (TPR) repeat [Candidatus Methanophagaceae archaeon]|nr:Tetratricopeptide (TPR) repeat [Methanophagales archaeon]